MTTSPPKGNAGASAAAPSRLPQFSDDELIRGEALFKRPWLFVKGVVAVEGLPPALRTEIAFAGRSNVGKSSLINALVRTSGLARTSNTPGRTQELNYFTTRHAPLDIVDMPGYGFAQAPKDKVDAWTGLVRDYLRGRPTLARTFVLIDARHGIKAVDEEILELLDMAAVSYQVVLTKADKLNLFELADCVDATLASLSTHPAAFPVVLPTSSETGYGLPELRAAIATLLSERTDIVWW